MSRPSASSMLLPPQAAPMGSTVHEFPIYVDSHSFTVMDASKSTVLYSVDKQSSKPHLSISRRFIGEATDRLLATVTFHRTSSDVDVDMVGGLGGSHRLDMQCRGILSRTHELNASGLRWTWGSDGFMSTDLRLDDVNTNRTIAKFTHASSWSRKKCGTLRVMGVDSPAVLDAVVVTALAKIEDQRRRKKKENKSDGNHLLDVVEDLVG